MRNYALVFFLLLFALNCQAQKNYRFESISVDDGLSQSGVLCIVQDKLGYLWIGTQDGLNKYDGYTIDVFRHKEGDSTSLPKNFITNLFLDHEDNLWVGTFGYLSKYNVQTGAFTNYRVKKDVLPNKEQSRIFLCRDNSFALTTGEELVFFDPETGNLFIKEEFKFLTRVQAYFETKNSGDWIFAEKTFYKPHGQNDWKEVNITGFPYYHESSGQLLLSTSSRGILKFSDRSNTWEEFISVGGEVMIHSNSDVWIGRQDGIYIYDSLGKFQQQVPTQAIVPGSIQTFLNYLYQTRDGVVWVGTNGYGLKKYNSQTNRFGLIGASTNAAVHLSHAYVDAIYTSDDTTLYVSTPAGLDIINIVKNTSQHLPFPTRIIRMTMDSKGRLWCSAWGGLYQLRNKQFVKMGDWIDYQDANLQPDQVDIGWIRSIIKKGEPQLEKLFLPYFLIGDSLWVNTSGIGDRHTFVNLTIANINTGRILREFKYDPADPTSAPRSESIKLIFQDSRKNIWVGSNSEGLCLYNATQNNFIHFTEKDGLPNNVVYGILEDDVQNLWLSTNKGLCEFNPVTKKVRIFDVYDGLQSNEFNTGAYFKSTSGKMYFGGVNGLTYFHPKDIITSNAAPQSAISGFYINNVLLKDYSDYVREDEQTKELTLSLQYHERDFGFDVVGIGFSLPGRTQYRYMLENYDNQWHDIGNLRHINFTNIPPGEYVFKIQSSDSFGNWETTGASAQVLIQAPIWANTWVWLIALLSLILFIILVYYIRVNQLKKETQKLEKIVDERTQKIQLQREEIAAQNEELVAQASYLEEKNTELERAKGLLEIEVKYLHQQQLLKSSIQTQEEERKRIAQDLHDELGAVLSIARMHLVQIQNHKAMDMAAMQSGLQQARMLTETALATMRRISHDLMPPQLENFGLIKTLESITTQVQDAKKISVHFQTPDDLLRWPLPIELGLYRICMEMINNTLKHAEATQISIDLKQVFSETVFVYADNGKGLPPVFTASHGFKNMEARVNSMGGSLSIGNGSRGGFCATIKIPL